MWVKNSAGKRYYVPPQMEEYVYKKQGLFIESISEELANAPAYDANGFRTNEGVILQDIKSRFPNVGVDDVEYDDQPHTVVQEEKPMTELETDTSPDMPTPDIVDNTWTKKEIVTYLVHTNVIDEGDEDTHMRMLKTELIALANGDKGKSEN